MTIDHVGMVCIEIERTLKIILIMGRIFSSHSSHVFRAGQNYKYGKREVEQECLFIQTDTQLPVSFNYIEGSLQETELSNGK